jgi:hypothetical protein
MNRKRNLKTAMLLALRKAGWICKKPGPTPRLIRVSKSILPDGTVAYYDKPLKEMPLNPDSFASELHIYHEVKKLGNPKK